MKPLRRTLRMNREGFFMAERRMFNARLLSSDRFLDLSAEAQVLYFHLGLHADDDGFLTRARAICRMIGVGADSLEELVSRGFLLAFESGACVLRHWRQHNSIRKDRYTPTDCRQEFQQLILLEDESYVRKDQAESVPGIVIMEPVKERPSSEKTEETQNNPSQAETELGKVIPLPKKTEGTQNNPLPANAEPCRMIPLPKTGKKTEDRVSLPTLEEVREYARERESRVSPDLFYDYNVSLGWQTQRGNQIVDWKAAFRCWEKREEEYGKSSGGKKRPRLPVQDYEQRSYAGWEESVDDMMKRLQKINGEAGSDRTAESGSR